MTTKNREQYQTKAENEFNRLAEQLGRFMARLETKARKEYRSLDEKSQTVKERLTTLRGASSDAWQDLKPGFESAWADLTDAFVKAKQHFSEEKSEAN